MVLEFIAYILGFLSGVILIALLNGNKHDETETERKEMFKLGYREGYERGSQCGYEIGYEVGLQSYYENKK